MKSMRRVSRGRSFLGLMTYLLRRDAEHRQQPGVPIGGTVCGTTAQDMARELRSAAQQRPDIIKPVWHQALRLPQGERLPPLTWCRIAEVFMEEMGFDTAQQPYAVVLHNDPQGQHIHIAASRVGMDGRIYLGQNENLRASRRVSELEKRFDLQRTPGPDARVNQRRRPTRQEQGMRQRTGEAVPREVLQDRIDSVLADGPVALDDFKERLAADGIGCLLNQAPGTSRICGISFSYGGLAFKGSQLGKLYAIAGLQKRGLSLAPLPTRGEPAPTPEAAAMPAPSAMAEQPTTRPKTLFEAILGHPPPELRQSPHYNRRTQPPRLNLCRRTFLSCPQARTARRKVLLQYPMTWERKRMPRANGVPVSGRGMYKGIVEYAFSISFPYIFRYADIQPFSKIASSQ